MCFFTLTNAALWLSHWIITFFVMFPLLSFSKENNYNISVPFVQSFSARYSASAPLETTEGNIGGETDFIHIHGACEWDAHKQDTQSVIHNVVPICKHKTAKPKKELSCLFMLLLTLKIPIVLLIQFEDAPSVLFWFYPYIIFPHISAVTINAS